MYPLSPPQNELPLRVDAGEKMHGSVYGEPPQPSARIRSFYITWLALRRLDFAAMTVSPAPAASTHARVSPVALTA